MQVTLSSKGQITLPKLLREHLHLKTGDKILFEEYDGGYLLKPQITDVKSLKGCVAYRGEPKTLEDMQQAITDNANI